MKAIRTETAERVRSLILCRAKEYNTITPQLRDELAQAIDDADDDRDVHVILLRAEGPAFCAGYGLDWSTAAQADERKTRAPAVPTSLHPSNSRGCLSLRQSIRRTSRNSVPAHDRFSLRE